MLQINQLLERFKNLKNGDKVKKQLIKEVFDKKNIPINIDQISITKDIIFLKINPIVKTEVFLKKEEILRQIKEISIISFISDIK